VKGQRRRYRTFRNQQGFTLVELMIALALGLVISGVSIKMYLESRRSYIQDEEMARLQENARFAIDFLKREISLSGFLAGINDTSGLNAATITTDCNAAGTDWVLDLNSAIELINNAPTGGTLMTLNGTELSCINADEIVDGTDIISLKRTSDTATLNNGVLQATPSLNTWYLKKFDYTSYSWSYLTGGITAAESTPNSTYDYWRYFTNIYYIRDYSVSEDDEIPTLCVSMLEGSEMINRCLIEGIEDIQIEIGIDNDGDNVVDQYKNAPSATDFDNALSVRLHILARSISPVSGYTNRKKFRLGVKNIDAFNDSYLRKVFSTTIKLRNTDLG